MIPLVAGGFMISPFAIGEPNVIVFLILVVPVTFAESNPIYNAKLAPPHL